MTISTSSRNERAHLLCAVVRRQDFVANSDVSDTSAGMYEMTSPSGIPVNGACPPSLSNRRRMTSVAAQIIGNTAATTAAAAAAAAAATAAGGSSFSGPSSAPSGAGSEGLASVIGGGASTATEQQLSRMLDKIYETIELNELRLLIQEHKDAVKLEWQQVTKIVSLRLQFTNSISALLKENRCLHYSVISKVVH